MLQNRLGIDPHLNAIIMHRHHLPMGHPLGPGAISQCRTHLSAYTANHGHEILDTTLAALHQWAGLGLGCTLIPLGLKGFHSRIKHIGALTMALIAIPMPHVFIPTPGRALAIFIHPKTLPIAARPFAGIGIAIGIEFDPIAISGPVFKTPLVKSTVQSRRYPLSMGLAIDAIATIGQLQLGILHDTVRRSKQLIVTKDQQKYN